MRAFMEGVHAVRRELFQKVAPKLDRSAIPRDLAAEVVVKAEEKREERAPPAPEPEDRQWLTRLDAELPVGYRPGTRYVPRFRIPEVREHPSPPKVEEVRPSPLRMRVLSSENLAGLDSPAEPKVPDKDHLDEDVAIHPQPREDLMAYWRLSDPLQRVIGELDPLAEISACAAPVEVDTGLFAPLEKTSLWRPTDEGCPVTGEQIRPVEGARRMRDARRSLQPEIVPPSPVQMVHQSLSHVQEVKIGESGSVLMTRLGTTSSRIDLDFLDRRTGEIRDPLSSQMHERLRKVWDRLEFSTAQKLSMSIRYSERIDQVERFSAVVALWEAALAAYDRSRAAVLELRDIVTRTHNPRREVLDPAVVELRRAQDEMRRAAQVLETSGGTSFA